ncbi:MAG: M4 family metallopeptidase [Gemmatimonadetes bacterium]|nr:M4 family metallopeptidase [Gemmatimonadota bacterium]
MRKLHKGTYRTVPGEFYGTPKEVWGFRSPARRNRPEAVAREFLGANTTLFGLDTRLEGLRLAKTIHSVGADHVILQQIHRGLRVHRAYVTTHIDLAGRVYLAKNRAVPVDLLPDESAFRVPLDDVLARARRSLPKPKRRAVTQDVERLWYPREHRLEPAWKVRLIRTRPREEWIVYVNARTGGLISRYDNLSAASGRARVFNPSPVTELDGHESLLTPGGAPRSPPSRAYRTVRLLGLEGNGRLEGARVTTRPTHGRHRVRRANHDFMLDAGQRGFEEVMVYHHIDAAIRYLQRLGYRGRRAIFRHPVEVNVNGTRMDNSWYSPWERRLTFGTGAIDDAEDGETILHELGHAIQDAICPDFGQSAEAAAMGEGFGDYFAASFFEHRKPERYHPCVMTWDGLLIGLKDKLDPPCLRRIDHDWTAHDFNEDDGEHANGEIWSATLWDIRQELGRDIADRLIIESHFQLDGFTTFARGARAILDADANLQKARHTTALRAIFRDRRIGPV